MKTALIIILLVSIISCGNNTETVSKDSDLKKVSKDKDLEMSKSLMKSPTNNKEKPSNAMVGGWKINEEMVECKLPEEIKIAFNEINIVGAKYVPVLYVGHQLVSGKNYMLICKQTLATQEQSQGVVQMTIYKPLNGPAVITEIKPILNYKFTS